MHAKIISSHPDCNLKFIYDVNKDFALQVAETNNAKVCQIC